MSLYKFIYFDFNFLKIEISSAIHIYLYIYIQINRLTDRLAELENRMSIEGIEFIECKDCKEMIPLNYSFRCKICEIKLCAQVMISMNPNGISDFLNNPTLQDELNKLEDSDRKQIDIALDELRAYVRNNPS